MLKCSELMGHIKASPRLPDSLPIQPARDRVVSPREQEAFIAYFQAICEPEAADMFTFLIDVGCRWSEAERMQSGEVDVKRRCVYFPKTKNGRPRTVPLTGHALGRCRKQAVTNQEVPGVRLHLQSSFSTYSPKAKVHWASSTTRS
jgi:integrase